MNRLASRLFLIALAALPAVAQDGSSTQSPEPRALLWKVSKPDGKHMAYLAGTFHMGVAIDKLPPVLWKALDECAILATEIDMRDPSIMRDAAMKHVSLPAGKTLDGLLGQATFDKLVASLNVAPEQLKPVRPLFLAMQIQAAWLPQTEGTDAHIHALATKAKKELAWLETPEEQMAMFLGLGDQCWADQLKDLVNEGDKAKEQLHALHTAYHAGDADKMIAILHDPESEKKYPGMMKVMFDDRNAAWIPKIEAMLERGNTYVAVGTGHLLGPGSVVELLQKRGYAVDRVAR